MRVLDRLHIDDAVYATALHFVDGIWVSVMYFLLSNLSLSEPVDM